MKIRCIRFINESSGGEQESCSWLTIGKIYSVLFINCNWSGNFGEGTPLAPWIH